MPLLGFRPTKARLIIEDAKESVLVMKVVADADDIVELATGGVLHDLAGVLRIREGRVGKAAGGGAVGSVVYVAGNGRDTTGSSARFQVNVLMSAEKFTMLLRVANAGRLPTRFFVDAGARTGRADPSGLAYKMRSAVRVKLWDNHATRSLPVTNFVMILPIDVPTVAVAVPPGAAVPAYAEPATGPAPVAAATNAQVADLMDDMLVFQSDTRHTMFGLVLVLGLVALAALAVGVGVLFR
jgi:hypothetical protein